MGTYFTQIARSTSSSYLMAAPSTLCLTCFNNKLMFPICGPQVVMALIEARHTGRLMCYRCLRFGPPAKASIIYDRYKAVRLPELYEIEIAMWVVCRHIIPRIYCLILNWYSIDIVKSILNRYSIHFLLVHCPACCASAYMQCTVHSHTTTSRVALSS
jgi:hypothetical protein